jgi:hypothetical protein
VELKISTLVAVAVADTTLVVWGVLGVLAAAVLGQLVAVLELRVQQIRAVVAVLVVLRVLLIQRQVTEDQAWSS